MVGQRGRGCANAAIVIVALLTCLEMFSPRHAPGALVTFTGTVANGEGTVGHAELGGPPSFTPPAPYNANSPFNQLTHHPQGPAPGSGILGGVYTRLVSRDRFDTATGAELALSAHLPPFAGKKTSPNGLEGIGINGTLYESFRSYTLNVNNASDYNYNTSTNVERRTYRGGEHAFYHDDGSGPTLFARNSGAELLVSIDWNTFIVSLNWSGGISDTGPGMLAMVESGGGLGSAPVNESGTTSGGSPYSGRFGLYDEQMSFSIVAIPEPGCLISAGLLLALTPRRRLVRLRNAR